MPNDLVLNVSQSLDAPPPASAQLAMLLVPRPRAVCRVAAGQVIECDEHFSPVRSSFTV